MIETVKLINEKRNCVSDENFTALVDSLREIGLLETEDIARTVTKLVETNTSFNLKSAFSRTHKHEHQKELQGPEEIYLSIRKTTLFLKVVIFARTDILSVCRDTNFSKILRDSSIELSWKIEDISDASSSMLLRLVKKRFDNVWGDNESFIDIWNQIFQPIDASKSSLEYVLENIIYRQGISYNLC